MSAKVHRMVCARWDAGTGHGVVMQPLTLAFLSQEAAQRARRMGGQIHPGYEILPVLVTIEELP